MTDHGNLYSGDEENYSIVDEVIVHRNGRAAELLEEAREALETPDSDAINIETALAGVGALSDNLTENRFVVRRMLAHVSLLTEGFNCGHYRGIVDALMDLDESFEKAIDAMETFIDDHLPEEETAEQGELDNISN